MNKMSLSLIYRTTRI